MAQQVRHLPPTLQSKFNSQDTQKHVTKIINKKYKNRAKINQVENRKMTEEMVEPKSCFFENIKKDFHKLLAKQKDKNKEDKISI